MWCDYEGDKILVNSASHRAKCEWIRKRPQLTLLIVNPDNPYHWVQIKCTVQSEAPPYGLRDPGIDEKRVLFICRVDRIATSGKP